VYNGTEELSRRVKLINEYSASKSPHAYAMRVNGALEFMQLPVASIFILDEY
jgi:hypothetical protein